MDYKIEINETQDEDILVIAKCSSSLLQQIEALLQEEQPVRGYSDRAIIQIRSERTFCFYIEDNRVYAQTKDGTFYVKERLYQLEDIFANQFVKINQSCLINQKEIEKFEVSLGGSLSVVLTNGYRDYISRRQLKQVKERFGI